MSQDARSSAVSIAAPTRVGGMSRSDWRLWSAIAIIGLYVVVAVFGPLVLQYDPVATSTSDRLLPPGAALADGSRAILGTDQLGRDVLSQVLQGARVSLLVGSATLLLAGFFGVAIGIASGFFGGWLDSLMMRLADIQLAFPAILFAILIASILGPSVRNVILTLAVTKWVVFARVARAQTLTTKERDFVDATRVLGAGRWHLIRRSILPAVLTPVGIVATVELGLVILAEASLSFLGLGTTLSMPSWGLTIANGRDYLGSAWWIATVPGIALAFLIVTFGTLGDELRDRYDPAIRGTM